MSKLIKKHKSKIALILAAVLAGTAVIGGTLAFVVTKTPSLLNTFIADHSGDITIKKTVEHPFGGSYVIPDSIKFDFKVLLGEGYANQSVTVVTADEPSGSAVTADAEGIINLSIKPNQSVIIDDVTAGTQVTVEEILSPGSGFTVKGDAVRTFTVEKGGETLEYTNIYDPRAVILGGDQGGGLNVHGTKVIEGRDWMQGDSYTIILEKYNKANDTWTEVGKVTTEYKTVTTTDANGVETVVPDPEMGKFSFTQLLIPEEGKESMFDEAGTYSFRIREEAGSLPGMVYDSANYAFDVLVGDADMDGTLEIHSVTTSAGDNNPAISSNLDFDVAATVTNRYAPAGHAEVKIEIKKKTESTSGEEKSPEGFTFELYDEAGNLVKTAVSSSTGDTAMTLGYGPDDVGKSFNYTLKEKNDGKAGWTYDTTEYPITVTVVDDLDGTFSAYIGETEDNNNGNTPSGNGAAGASLEPNATPAPELTVEPDVTPEPTTTTEPEIGGEDNGEGGEAGDETITTARRSVVQGTTVRLTARRFPNAPAGVYAKLNTTPADGTDAAGIPVPSPTATPEVTSSPEPVDSPAPSLAPMGNGGGSTTPANLSLQPAGETVYNAEFTNSYAPVPANGKNITGKKTLTGRTLNPNEFEFALYTVGEDGDLGSELLSVTNGENGEFVFDMSAVAYSSVGTYRYAVKEVKGNLGGVTYDESVFSITVTVTDNSGVLEAAAEIKNDLGAQSEIEFENQYAPASAAFAIRGKKELTGDAYSGEAFRFSLYKANNSAEFAKDGAAIETVSRSDAGSFAFAEIGYTAVGEYCYRVEEETGTVNGMAYDSTAYGVVITVTDNGAGQLVANSRIVKIGGSDVDGIVFVNSYTKPAATPTPSAPVTPAPTPGITPTPAPGNVEIPVYPGDSGVPPTGDNNPIGLYTALLLISAGAIVGLVIYGNGKSSNKRKGKKRRQTN